MVPICCVGAQAPLRHAKRGAVGAALLRGWLLSSAAPPPGTGGGLGRNIYYANPHFSSFHFLLFPAYMFKARVHARAIA